jgi:hypothetical protein
MRVAPDLESPIRMGGASNNASGADQANPYATIQKPRRALPSIHLGEEVGEVTTPLSVVVVPTTSTLHRERLKSF